MRLNLDKAEQLLTVSSSTLACPITHDKMRDPVVAADGFTYERSAIEAWFRSSRRSPSTNADLPNTTLVPNRILRQIIEDATEIGQEITAPQFERACLCKRKLSSTGLQCWLPAGGEKGLWVYEVVRQTVIAFAEADDITSVDATVSSTSPSTGWVFVEGQLISCSFRKSNAAGIDVVMLEHGLGWVCAAHLRAVPISAELKVCQVGDMNIGKRAVPDHRRAVMGSGSGVSVRAGQVLSSTQWVTDSDGTTYLRVEGGWIPDRSRQSGGRMLPMLRNLEIDRSLVVFRVVNEVGLALRTWPCSESEKVQPRTTVAKGTLVGSRTWVRGEHGEVCALVEVSGVSGWLFATRDGATTMEKVATRPTVHCQAPGYCVQAQLGQNEGAWILLVDDPGAGRQTHHWTGITEGLACQINNCDAKGRRVRSIAMCPDGSGWACDGVRVDGSGWHTWTGGLSKVLADVLLTDGMDRFSLGTNDQGMECGVAWSSSTGELTAHNVPKSDVKDMRKGKVERVCLLHDAQFWVKYSDGTQRWRLRNKHLEREIQSVEDVLAVSICPDSGAWLVIAAESYSCSVSMPAELEHKLSKVYARLRAQRAAQRRAAAEFDEIAGRRA